MNIKCITMTEDMIFEKIGEGTITHAEMVEFFVMRDEKMKLDMDKHLQMCMEKLRPMFLKKLTTDPTFGDRMLRLSKINTNRDFYEACTLDELFFLGY